MKAQEQEPLKFDVRVLCPECGKKAEVRASRKGGRAAVECVACGVVEQGVIPYGEGVVVNSIHD